MRAATTLLMIGLAGGMSACDQPTELASCELPLPPPGSNEVLRTSVEVAEGLEVIISDVYIPPGVTVPRHYHPGEEFMYVLSGSATQVEEGKADRLLEAGDAYVISREAVHEPVAGERGGRAIVFRLHKTGMAERIAVPRD